jgi:hypothetical protein
MTIELLTLRQASQNLDYHNRVSKDAAKFGTQAKAEKQTKTDRNLKKARESFKKALEACNDNGISYSQEHLPKSITDEMIQA